MKVSGGLMVLNFFHLLLKFDVLKTYGKQSIETRGNPVALTEPYFHLNE